MCGIISVSKRDLRSIMDARQRHLISVPIMVESLWYQSHVRKVDISFDVVIRNDSSMSLRFYLTHNDFVGAWLTTRDWFWSPPGDEQDPDPRRDLMRRVYGDSWKIREDSCLELRDALMCDLQSEPVAVAVPVLGPNNAVDLSYALTIDDTSCHNVPNEFGNWNLHHLPCLSSPWRETDEIPYSSFAIGTVPAGTTAYLRVQVVIEGSTYERLLRKPERAGEESREFEVISGLRVLDRAVENLADYRWSLYHERFQQHLEENIWDSIITPERYQILILQPREQDQGHRLVHYYPTSTMTTRLPIEDEFARHRCLWFDTFSEDFSLDLRYGNLRREAGQPHESQFTAWYDEAANESVDLAWQRLGSPIRDWRRSVTEGELASADQRNFEPGLGAKSNVYRPAQAK